MNSDKGFTLIEILISLTVGLIVLAAIYTSIEVSQRSSVSIDRKISSSQDARTALEIMASEIRMASYNPSYTTNMWCSVGCGGAGTGVQANKGIQQATSTTITVEMDINENTAIDNTGSEIITYNYNANNQMITRSTSCGNAESFLGENSATRTVRVVNGNTPVFQYFDRDGNATNNIPDIKRVLITLIVQSAQNSAMSNQPITTIYTTSVVPRNHAIASPY